jgi:hypothetical protein
VVVKVLDGGILKIKDSFVEAKINSYIHNIIKNNMAKLTEQSANGTSFHDSVIKTTVNKLVNALGKAQYIDNTGEDKVNFSWDCETKDGEVFTIYDWKEYRSIDLDETIEFHIGGDNKIVTEKAKRELLDILK